MIGTMPATGVPVAIANRLLGVFHECRTALDGLEHCTGDPAEHIHCLRKRGKRLRGGLTLLEAPQPVMHDMRDMGRMLGAARDVAVRAATLRSLHDEPGESYELDAAQGIAEALMAEEASFGGGTPSAPVLGFLADRLAGAEAWLRELPPEITLDGLAGSIGRLEADVLKRLDRLARKGTKPARFHAARKAVKRLHGALWFIRPEGELPLVKVMRRLAALGDDLGGINDLDVLDGWLNRAGLTAARLPGLYRAIKRRRRRLGEHVKRRARAVAASLAAG